MTLFRTTRRRITLLGRITAGVSAALLGLLIWLAVDPNAHAAVHASHAGCSHEHADHRDARDDMPAGDDEHECAITRFASGHVLLLAITLEVVRRLEPQEFRVARAVAPPNSPINFRLPPGRGPPAV